MRRYAWLMVILIFLSSSTYGAELMMPGTRITQPGIFFPDGPMVYEVLKRAEQYPSLQRENQTLTELVAQDNASIAEAARRMEMGAVRITELGNQLDNCFGLQKQTVKTMDEIQKIKDGTWLDRVKNAVLFVVVGIAIGYAAAK